MINNNNLFYEMKCLTTSKSNYRRLEKLVDVSDRRESFKIFNIFIQNNIKNLDFLGINCNLEGHEKEGSISFESSQYVGAIPMMSSKNIQIGDFCVTPRFANTKKFEEYTELMNLLEHSIEYEIMDSAPLKSEFMKPPLYLECMKFINLFDLVLKSNWRMFDNVNSIENLPIGEVDWKKYYLNEYKIENRLRFPCKKNILNIFHNELAKLKYVFLICQKEILSTNTPSKIRNSLSDKLHVMGKKLHKLQPITVDKLVVKASDKQAIKTTKVQANKILNSHATKGVAWRVDFNKVFEKFVEYLFKKTMNIVGGSMHENRTIYSQNPFNKLSLSHLEPDIILEKNQILFFVDAKYKSHFFNKSNLTASLKDEIRKDQHQVMAYSSFSKSKDKFCFLCYPSAEVNYEKNRYINNINGTETHLYSIGIPLSLKEMNKTISFLSFITNEALSDKNKSAA